MTDTVRVNPERPCLMNHDYSDEKTEIYAKEETACILNDFCLLQIINRLDLSDLCNVVNVNKQFHRVSVMSFSVRYESFVYPDHLKVGLMQLKSDMKCQMRRVFCNFGHFIKSLSLRDFDPAGVFTSFRVYPIEIDVISKYCAGTLEKLRLHLMFRFDCDLAKPLFPSLKVLIINCGDFDGDASGLFKECEALKILKIYRLPYTEFTSQIAQKFPNLDELYINTFLNVETMSALLQMNLQIKKLHLLDHNASKSLCPTASKLENLEELILLSELNNYENISELGKLKSLKILELHGVAYEFVPAIDAMQNVPLEGLKWLECPSDLKFMNNILKLKTLKSLALTRGVRRH